MNPDKNFIEEPLPRNPYDPYEQGAAAARAGMDSWNTYREFSEAWCEYNRGYNAAWLGLRDQSRD